MIRTVVNVATDSWLQGQVRLGVEMTRFGEQVRLWSGLLPMGCPTHQRIPYAFKAYALRIAADEGAHMLIWVDASVIPIRPLKTVWDQIERDGYFICRNGWDNHEWTADSAYADLFPGVELEHARQMNSKIPHVVGTAFGLAIGHPIGRAFLTEYYRYASETRAFCGPWQNTEVPRIKNRNDDRTAGPCGPKTTLGHRHDQTCMSVIAHRLGMKLTDGPHVFAYAKRTVSGAAILDPAQYEEDTVLLAVGV